MDHLRKVIFTLEGEKTIGRYEVPSEKERKELEEKQRKREGLFHRWCDKVSIIDGQSFTETYAIVEEIETGKLIDVLPKRIQLID